MQFLDQEEVYSVSCNRLCHILAILYFEQKDFVKAECFAKRAFNGRERNRPFLLNESISLFVKVYEQRGDRAKANVFRRRFSVKQVVIEPCVSSFSEHVIQESENGIFG